MVKERTQQSVRRNRRGDNRRYSGWQPLRVLRGAKIYC